MTQQELFAGLFPLPYEHGKWLADQKVLIERMAAANDAFLTEQSEILQKFQDASQCSSIMLELMVDRVKRWENQEKITVDNDKVM